MVIKIASDVYLRSPVGCVKCSVEGATSFKFVSKTLRVARRYGAKLWSHVTSINLTSRAVVTWPQITWSYVTRLKLALRLSNFGVRIWVTDMQQVKTSEVRPLPVMRWHVLTLTRAHNLIHVATTARTWELRPWNKMSKQTKTFERNKMSNESKCPTRSKQPTKQKRLSSPNAGHPARQKCPSRRNIQ